MEVFEIRLPPGESERRAECAVEAIRFPEAIQPHGLMLAVNANSLAITAVSDNADALIEAEPLMLLGNHLADVVGHDVMPQVLDILDPLSVAANPARVTMCGREFDLIAHSIGVSFLVELEPVIESDEYQIAAMRAAIRQLTSARTESELWAQTAVEVRRVTGFDQVMVYHFHPDGHGEIVAESLAEGMESYLGLHYPASDIPAQARQLYLSKLSRLIVNSTHESAVMLVAANDEDAAALDMSCAELRAVSPHHLQFMRNIGQVSTFSLSIVRDGRLVGMITCAHRTERRISFGTRDGLEILAIQVALQLGAMGEIERSQREEEIRKVSATLLNQVATHADIAEALVGGNATLLDVVPADGATVRLGKWTTAVGTVPSLAQISAVVAKIVSETQSLNFSSSALPLDYPELASELPGIAGLLVRRLGGKGDFIAWYRKDVARTVNWLGDPALTNRLTPLTPRSSFSMWGETVTGTSLPWAGSVSDASELCRDLDSALLHRAESLLADLALSDPLTSLPNRRLFMDRLEHGIARHARGDNFAVLFIDLDLFKEINDTWGHAVGDDALVRVALALSNTARLGDTVARLGGDEFVVLCEHATTDAAKKIAERMLTAVRELAAEGASWHLSASIGVAAVDSGLTASQILTKADSAMYRAKHAGGDQVSVS